MARRTLCLYLTAVLTLLSLTTAANAQTSSAASSAGGGTPAPTTPAPTPVPVFIAPQVDLTLRLFCQDLRSTYLPALATLAGVPLRRLRHRMFGEWEAIEFGADHYTMSIEVLEGAVGEVSADAVADRIVSRLPQAIHTGVPPELRQRTFVHATRVTPEARTVDSGQRGANVVWVVLLLLGIAMVAVALLIFMRRRAGSDEEVEDVDGTGHVHQQQQSKKIPEDTAEANEELRRRLAREAEAAKERELEELDERNNRRPTEHLFTATLDHEARLRLPPERPPGWVPAATAELFAKTPKGYVYSMHKKRAGDKSLSSTISGKATTGAGGADVDAPPTKDTIGEAPTAGGTGPGPSPAAAHAANAAGGAGTAGGPPPKPGTQPQGQPGVAAVPSIVVSSPGGAVGAPTIGDGAENQSSGNFEEEEKRKAMAQFEAKKAREEQAWADVGATPIKVSEQTALDLLSYVPGIGPSGSSASTATGPTIGGSNKTAAPAPPAINNSSASAGAKTSAPLPPAAAADDFEDEAMAPVATPIPEQDPGFLTVTSAAEPQGSFPDEDDIARIERSNRSKNPRTGSPVVSHRRSPTPPAGSPSRAPVATDGNSPSPSKPTVSVGPPPTKPSGPQPTKPAPVTVGPPPTKNAPSPQPTKPHVSVGPPPTKSGPAVSVGAPPVKPTNGAGGAKAHPAGGQPPMTAAVKAQPTPPMAQPRKHPAPTATPKAAVKAAPKVVMGKKAPQLARPPHPAAKKTLTEVDLIDMDDL